MALKLQVSQISAILPKLIEEGRNLIVAQSRFRRRMNQVHKTNRINPGSLYTPYTIEENNTAFGVSEGGPILGGSAPEYTMGTAQIRQHWASVVWTGAVERIRDNYLTDLRRDPAYEGKTLGQLQKLAQNKAVKDHFMSALKMYARRENFFALQGTDKSAIGVVTGLPGGTTVQFSWDTTNQGNRLFDKDQLIQFYSPGGAQRTTGLTASQGMYYSKVTSADKTPASGATGPVVFDALPTAAPFAVGDTAHFINSYGLFPVGFLEYVNNTGTFKGITRSTKPEIFESVINTPAGTPTFAPTHIRETLSLVETKMGYDEEMMFDIWMNKTQYYNYGNQVYSAPWTILAYGNKPTDVDRAVGKLSWDGNPFRKDKDVPPAHVDIIDFRTFRKIEQTELQWYEFDSGQLVVSQLDAYGNRLDAKQSTMFSEYNWDCVDPRPNARIEGLAFSKNHI